MWVPSASIMSSSDNPRGSTKTSLYLIMACFYGIEAANGAKVGNFFLPEEQVV